VLAFRRVFLPLPHPRSPTPFPYTTLFRSERAGAIVLDQHVRPVGDETLQHLAPAIGLEVQRDRALVRALREEARAHHRLVQRVIDRKSTRLNSSHDQTSYAVFCLKKKKQT